MARSVARAQTMGDTTVHMVHRGYLTSPDMRLHDGFDGWPEPIAEVQLERLDPCRWQGISGWMAP